MRRRGRARQRGIWRETAPERVERPRVERRDGGSSETAGRGRSRQRRFGVALAVVAGGIAGPPAVTLIGEVLRRPPFRVEAVAVRGARRLSPADVVRASGLVPDTPLLDVDAAALEARIAALPAVARAHVLRLPPSRILVGVAERVARGVAAAGPEGLAHVVCARGVPFALATRAERARLPLLAGIPPAPVGEPSPGLREALAIADALSAAGFARPSRVDLGPESPPGAAALRLPGLAARVVLDRGDPAEAAARLAHLVALEPDLAAAATSIDLRFAGRAVLQTPLGVLQTPPGVAQAHGGQAFSRPASVADHREARGGGTRDHTPAGGPRGITGG